MDTLPRALMRVAAVSAVTAGLITLAGGGNAFWLTVPAALLVSAFPQTPALAALSAAVVVMAGVAPSLASATLAPPPPASLMILVPTASVAVLLTTHGRIRRERDALRASALSDALTGVANRRSLIARIEYEIARHTRAQATFALVMIDLDGFKLLNDRFGHPAGDDLLREVAAALEHAVREQDTVARIGGDEFCLLAPETDRAGAQRLAARATAAVSRVTAGIEALGASVGTAVFPDDGAATGPLLEAADERLFAVKRDTRRTAPRRRAA